MDERTNVIYRTWDYDKFKRLKGNRKVDNARVGKIIKSIKTVGYIQSPIAVNENMEVIDGQGRLQALKILGLPVDYYIVKGAGKEQCIAMNIYGTNWKVTDYIDSYAETGDVNYQRLQTLMDMYKEIGLVGIYNAITGKVGTGNSVIKNGELICTEDDFSDAMEILNFEKKFMHIFEKVKGRINNYYMAIGFCYRHSEVDNNALISAIELHQLDLIPVANAEQALEVIEGIYNIRRKVKVYLVTDFKKVKQYEKGRS